MELTYRPGAATSIDTVEFELICHWREQTYILKMITTADILVGLIRFQVNRLVLPTPPVSRPAWHRYTLYSLIYYSVSRYSTRRIQVATVDSDPCVVPSLVLRPKADRCKTGRGDSRNFYNHNIGPSPRYPSLKQGRFLWDPYRGALCVHRYFHHRQYST